MTTLVIVLLWITVMTLIFWRMPANKIKVAGHFFKIVMPKIPFKDIIDAWKNRKTEN